MRAKQEGFVGVGGGVAKDAPKPGAESPVVPQRPASFYDKQRGVVSEFLRTDEELKTPQEIPSYDPAGVTQGDENLAKEGFLRYRGGLQDNTRVETAHESFSETMRKKEAGGSVSPEEGQQPDWSQLSLEAMTARKKMLLTQINELPVEEARLSSAFDEGTLDAEGIQRWSEVKKQVARLEEKQQWLAGLETAMAIKMARNIKGGNEEQPTELADKETVN